MLSYKVEGNGPPVLLIHGWGVTYNIWRNLAPFLKFDFRLIMVELPGMGGSALPDPCVPYYEICAAAIDALRRELGIECWSVLSYSAGTRAAEVYVQRDAGHVQRAVFLCPAYLGPLQALGLCFISWLDELCPSTGNWMLSGWRLYNLVLWFGFNGQPHPCATEWTNEIGAQPILSLKASLYELLGISRRPFETPGLPALFVWGRNDVVVTPPRHPRLYDVIIPAGHGAPIVAAPDVAEAVLSFLAH